MLKTRKLLTAAALMACLAALPALGGCDNGTSQNADTTQPASTAREVTSNDQGSSSSSQQAPAFDPSSFLDDNGYWKGVDAAKLVTLCSDYTAIPVPQDQITATDEAVQAQVDSILQNYREVQTITDRAVADGDTVNIDYVGSIDGVEFEGGSTGGNGTEVTLGVTQYIPGFLEQLVGHTPGETFDIDVTFPADYHATDLAGKDAVFSVTINNIVERTLPELTDDWVAQNLQADRGWTTVDQMKEALASGLEQSALALYVQDYVIDNSTVSELPQDIVTFQQDMLLNQYQSYANSFGMSLEDMLSMMTGYSTPDAYLEANKDQIERAATGHLVFQAIAQDADITVTDEDVDAYLTDVAQATDLQSFKDFYGMPYLRMCALVEKVGDFLVTNAVIE